MCLFPSAEAQQPHFRCFPACQCLTSLPVGGQVTLHHFLYHLPWHHRAFWWWLFVFSLTHPLSKIKPTHHQKLPLDSTFHSLPHAHSFPFSPPYSPFAVGICCSSHCVLGGSTSAAAVCITAIMQAETKSSLQTRSQKHEEACNKENKTKRLLTYLWDFFL